MKILMKFKNLLKFLSIIILIIGLFLCFRYFTLNQMYYVDFYQVALCIILTVFVISMSVSLRRKAKIIEKIEKGIIVKTDYNSNIFLKFKISDRIYSILNFWISIILFLFGAVFSIYIGFMLPSPYGFEIIFSMVIMIPITYISAILMSNYVIEKTFHKYSKLHLNCYKNITGDDN